MAKALTREHVESFRRARLSRDPRQIEPFLDDNVDWLLTGPVELLHVLRTAATARPRCSTASRGCSPSVLSVLQGRA